MFFGFDKKNMWQLKHLILLIAKNFGSSLVLIRKTITEKWNFIESKAVCDKRIWYSFNWKNDTLFGGRRPKMVKAVKKQSTNHSRVLPLIRVRWDGLIS
jgi:hypothetical protein